MLSGLGRLQQRSHPPGTARRGKMSKMSRSKLLGTPQLVRLQQRPPRAWAEWRGLSRCLPRILAQRRRSRRSSSPESCSSCGCSRGLLASCQKRRDPMRRHARMLARCRGPWRSKSLRSKQLVRLQLRPPPPWPERRGLLRMLAQHPRTGRGKLL